MLGLLGRFASLSWPSRSARRFGGAGQTYPTHVITIVVSYSAGGGHDAMARIVARRLTTRLGQAVVVENKAGANGMIEADYVARAAPGGHAILFASPAEIVIAPSAYKERHREPIRHLAPVTLAATTPLVLVANSSLGVRTLPESLALAKKKPGTLSFGASGNATSQRLAGVVQYRLRGRGEEHTHPMGGDEARPTWRLRDRENRSSRNSPQCVCQRHDGIGDIDDLNTELQCHGSPAFATATSRS